MHRTSLIAALACLGLLAPGGSAHAAEPRTWDREFTVAPRPTVRIRTDDARVTVRSWKDARVKVHVEHRGVTEGLFVSRKKPVVDIGQQGNEVAVTAREGGVSGGIVFSSSRFEVEVWLPRRCDLVIDGQDGAVRVDDVEGRITIETQDGPLRARGLRGDVRVRSQDGHVELDDLDGALVLETQDGGSDVTGRFDALDVESSDGGIEVEARHGSKLREEWSLRSSDGGIRLRIPHDLAATIDARTADGGLSIDLPVEIQGSVRHHQIVGDLNGGGPTLRLRCNDGTIRVSAGD